MKQMRNVKCEMKNERVKSKKLKYLTISGIFYGEIFFSPASAGQRNSAKKIQHHTQHPTPNIQHQTKLNYSV
jgi:hypothetical protein